MHSALFCRLKTGWFQQFSRNLTGGLFHVPFVTYRTPMQTLASCPKMDFSICICLVSGFGILVTPLDRELPGLADTRLCLGGVVSKTLRLAYNLYGGQRASNQNPRPG
ncbi:hypothetical protein EJ04DRAFT_10613 [Polyplosphaeria fusca]|uniref:Uncharacterized protein n=1 Tax=Polyplosphaeria fusca TaxID=682080 RepID=A0A9P4QUQ6_9PLEO|nr:hypothetical protein EJ04DRAFT_10613 [Polyplosphaeria fusca]